MQKLYLSATSWSDSIFIADLLDTTLALDFRVSVLEESGGDEGNSSVADLEVRVETLEGTADDHETRISATEADLAGNLVVSVCLFKWKKIIIFPLYAKLPYLKCWLEFHFKIIIWKSLIADIEETVSDQETRLTAAEENIQGIVKK